MVKIIVGVAIVIGCVLLLGPMGLLLLVPAVLLMGWIFGQSNPEEDAKAKESVDAALRDMFPGRRK